MCLTEIFMTLLYVTRRLNRSSESSYVKSVTADMMSDEERRGDVYIWHQPEYHSEVLTHLS